MNVQGVVSGDHECWCLLVTKETFTKLRGEAPDEEFDVGPFSKEGSVYRYKIYPDDIFGRQHNEVGGKRNVIAIAATTWILEPE